MLTRLLSPTLGPSTTGLTKNPRLFFSGSPELLTLGILESENSLRGKPLPKTELSCLHLSSFQNLRLSIFGCFGSPELQFTLYKYLSITYCRPSRELRTKGKMSTKTDVVLPSYNLKSILWLRNNQVITHKSTWNWDEWKEEQSAAKPCDRWTYWGGREMVLHLWLGDHKGQLREMESEEHSWNTEHKGDSLCSLVRIEDAKTDVPEWESDSWKDHVWCWRTVHAVSFRTSLIFILRAMIGHWTILSKGISQWEVLIGSISWLHCS